MKFYQTFLLLIAFQFSISAQAANIDACENLFSASCLGSDGKNKFPNKFQENKDLSVKIISDARDKTARELGFKNFDEALKTELKNKGFEVKEPPDEKAWKVLKGEADLSGGYDMNEGKKLFADISNCEDKLGPIKNYSSYGKTDLAEVQKQVAQAEKIFKDLDNKLIQIYSKNISDFVTKQIGDKCRNLKSNPENYNAYDNPEAALKCKDFESIRQQAVRIFRLEGTPEYQEQAEKFVKDNLLGELKYSSYSGGTPAQNVSTSAGGLILPQKSELEMARNNYDRLTKKSYSYCNGFGRAMNEAGKKVADDFMIEINTSKTTVDAVLGSFYSEENRKTTESIVSSAKSEIQGMVKDFVGDREKRNKIINSYDSMKYQWMDLPSESFYKKGPRGNLILDENKAITSFNSSFASDPFGAFSDPKMTFFTTLNANYMPSIEVGALSFEKRVAIMPSFLIGAKENPFYLQSVIAHEVGHHIGPKLSRLNGFDLSGEYKELLACYKGNKSIHLQTKQDDETIADYISSEYLAIEIGKLPVDQREQALKSSMEAFCHFDAMGNQMQSLNCTESHPENSLRVSGIYGANPNLRKVVGCEGDSSQFASCGIKDIKLPKISEKKPSRNKPSRGRQ
jgi:hypothetical protein